MDNGLERFTFEASKLMVEEPAQLFSKNKRIVYDLSCPPSAVYHGKIEYSRWQKMDLPEEVYLGNKSIKPILQEGYYDYEPIESQVPVKEWHVNFADGDLFIAYGSDLFAQDETQVAEHPVLASLKQKLNTLRSDPYTVEHGEPTPILISGVERRCWVKTDPNIEEGRPFGLYGNAFGRVSEEVIKKATVVLNPPTLTNFIAISAPYGGEGKYTLDEVQYILETAYSGFKAAVIESGNAPTVIHTGFWGCGAYGGNRVLMTWLQIVAGKLAGVNQLIFHTGNSNQKDLKSDWAKVEKYIGKDSLPTDHFFKKILDYGFEWGESDGN
ncbi:hypothetical protein [Algoriphagus taiwanensis]|uniref:PARG catalytic Macro domain-containing protein n=1 Tax=Algoriphagus taiwanensis TaxID=1445656 RepID=A0ABQ6PWF1_9BACT|nr:hypothetical protein Ataiwa_01890 [Algoriphagus taiwanensis]